MPARTASTIPENVKQPADHRPAKDEVTGPQGFTVEWDGHEYFIEGENLDDAELLEFITDNNFIGALRAMIGPKQWAEYKKRARNESGKVTATGASEFLDHLLKEAERKNS